jgi:hypothetical protein
MAVSWMKKGEASAAAAKQDQAEAAKRREEQGKLWRYFLKPKEEGSLTFVDGDLSPEGFLLPPRYYEHNLYLNGSWNNHFVCPEKTNPEAGQKCPICEGGDRPTLVALFTVIDHRVFTSKNDSAKQYTDTVKILAAKPPTFEMLNKIAQKRGGLAGARFDVSRLTDKDAAVGSMFDFMEKLDVEGLKAKYVREVTDEKTKEKKKICFFVPANYETEIIYRDETELRQLGFGKPVVGGTAQKAQPVNQAQAQPQAGAGEQYSEHL